jgi:hypothetical protein
MHPRFRCLVTTALGVLALIGPAAALAWGAAGHRLVAELAGTQLSAPARAEVDRLLALEPGATLSSISTWADEVRSPTTSAWHYINFPRGECDAPPAQLCNQGMCVVAAIERQAAILSSKAPDEERLKALKYVVHFVADVHQPLHAGLADDKGGNTFQIQALGRGTNLHALWDSGMIQQWPGGLPALAASVAAEVRSDPSLAPGKWAKESCLLVATEGFYPSSHKLDDEYVQRWSPTLVRRLAAASRRLAAVLNERLAGK